MLDHERNVAYGSDDNDDDLDPLVSLENDNEEPSPPSTWAPPIPSSTPLPPTLQLPLNQEPTAGPALSILLTGLWKVPHPSSSMTLPGGFNILQMIDQNDDFAHIRANEANVHYPFVSHAEWQFAKWLGSAPLSQLEVDKFLHLDYVRQQLLSFKSAKDL
ncbi:hypothetical protein PILCRDRAFT_12162 [Piloderma croceum F 1598]|uniref:Uncharacterized protein n=1 Tax=Piloderma croceum (strain F 1598) TaxID=765440 RepID=A0A0C3BJ07_PILCF|nr:hypothetical protein PILCRDRAFT_12162 [Piloderma croceum F 1598]